MRSQLLTLLILALLPRLSLAAESAADGIWIFEDTTAALSFEDVVAMPDAFVQTTDTNIGFSDSAFWIRVELTNDTDERQTQVVQFDSHLLQLSEAYSSVTHSAVQLSGRAIAKHERPLPTMLPSVPVELRPGHSSIEYFKIVSDSDISIEYEVKSLNQAFTDSGLFEAMRYALALALFVLLAYNFAAALIIRQAVHWFYVGFVGLMLCTQLLDLGVFFRHDLQSLTAITLPLSLASGMMFLALLLGQMSSKWLRWSITGFCFFTTSAVATFIVSDTHPIIFGGLIPMVLVIVSAQVITGVIQHRPYSKLVLTGWAFFISGAIATALTTGGILPAEYISAYAVGSLLEATVFSIVLGFRAKHQEEASLEQQRQTNERQKELFAVIGHELRTPVASMAMVADDNDTSDAAVRQQVKSISNNLLSVLEDLRVVVAPERALESKLAVGHPANKVERAISPLKPMIEEAGFSVSLALPEKGEKHYHLHAQPLRQLVTNLVKNAMVHSGGDRVRVELTLDETDATQTQATLRIGDNGKGLTPTEQQHVFEAFGRGDTSSDGSGLGLFIVSQLVKKMDGSLSYETSKLGGACFVVSFLMEVAEQGQAQAQAQAQDILSGLNILLAEDDSFLAQLTQKMLSAKGANVPVAENGQIALDAFQTHVITEAFDVVITDLMMPELDGHGLVKAIRESDTQLPVIAVTAAVIGQETDQLMAEGATAVLSKPIKMDELAEVLTKDRLERLA